MAEVKYLYGFAVQGIQSYIFGTNKLSEIIGASEVVEEACTLWFSAFRKEHSITEEPLSAAAGSIKFLTSNREHAQLIFEKFPDVMRSKAAGVPFSQAIVEIDGNYDDDARNKMREALHAQRNAPMYSADACTMARARAPRTGGAAVRLHRWTNEKKAKTKGQSSEFFDALTAAKEYIIRDKATNKPKRNTALTEKAKIPEDFEKEYQYPFEFSQISSEDNKHWLAVIHADGNGIGKVIDELPHEQQKAFSEGLDCATKAAYKTALEKVVLTSEVLDSIEDGNLPIRPLILGGDDLTIIIRADLAIRFTQAYLQAFEEQTQEKLKETHPAGLKAAAGIAFVKEKFPFHYSINLAEQLCKYAKHKSNREVSAFQFHMVRDSFIGSYQDVIKRELTPKLDKSFSFEYGPYTLSPTTTGQGVLATEFIADLELFNNDKAGVPINGIREWISAKFSDASMADELHQRLIKQNPQDKIEKLLNNQQSLLMTMAAHTIM